MITFGYKNKFGGWIRSIVAIILGVLMLSDRHPEAALPLAVKVLASFLIAAGVVSIIYSIVNHKRVSTWTWIATAVVDIVLGIVFFCYPAHVAGILLLLIGIALIGFGLWEGIVLFSVTWIIPFGFLGLIIPGMCVLAGIFIVVNPIDSLATMTVVAGIALLFYGLSEFISTLRISRAIRDKELKTQAAAETAAKITDDFANAKEAEYDKVDEQ